MAKEEKHQVSIGYKGPEMYISHPFDATSHCFSLYKSVSSVLDQAHEAE